MELMGQVESLK